MNFNILLIACVILPMAIAGGLNGYLLSQGGIRTQQYQPATRSRLLPPGWVVGTIWIILFGILGYIFYLYRMDPVVAISIVILFVSCLLYPFYTRKFYSEKASKIGNTTTLILAFLVTIILAARAKQHQHILLMAPLLTWASYVNYTDNF